MKRMAYIAVFFIFATFMAAGCGGSNSTGSSEIIPAERRTDWKPGLLVHQSAYPVFANVKNPPYSAAGNDVSDDTQAIQNAIDDCPPGSAVFLPEGTYRVSDALNISKGIVLRGEGPQKTRIRNYKNSSGNIILIRGSGSSSGSISITGGHNKGSSQISVASTANLDIGDYVRMFQDNDPVLVDIGGCNWCGDSGQHVLAQIAQIQGISGNTVTLNRPLYHTFSASLNPELKTLSMVEGAGIENLYIEKVNGGGSYSSTNNIQARQSANSWIRNIESVNAVGAHIRMESSYANEIRDSYFHHGHSYGSGRAYGVFLYNRNSDILVENNTFYYLRHSMVLESGGSGNVFGYNYSRRMFGDTDPADTNWLMADLSSHGAHPFMNLFEGNSAQHLGPDYTWGSASHMTYFRNHIIRENQGVNQMASYHLIAVDIQSKNYYMNLVGNIFCKDDSCSGNYEAGFTDSSSDKVIYRLGYSSDGSHTLSDPLVADTLLRHGNFDFITDTTEWDPSITDHNLPNSLYLTSKPTFFGVKSWPVYGPDLDPMVGVLPAEERFILGGGSDDI